MIKNKDKWKKILNKISHSDTREAFKSVAISKKKVQELKEQIESIFNSIGVLKEELKENKDNISGELNEKLFVLKSTLTEYKSASLERLGGISQEISNLKKEIQAISQRKVEIPDFERQLTDVEGELGNAISDWKLETEDKVEEILTETKKTISDLEEAIKKLRADTMSAMSGRVVGGGNMNRNILVGNNPSTLGRYTDLNILAGSNVTLSYTNNDNLKTTNLTIAATGGSGTNRNISTVNVSSVIASVNSTDYVIIAGAGIKLDMPTASGNTNLYTIKNKSISSVMIVANGAETIDGDANIILATQYVSVDLISDDANFHIT